MGADGEVIPLLTALPLLQRLLFFEKYRSSLGVTKSQFVILTVLSYRESLTMKEIAGYIVSSSEQATRAVAPLVEAGYAERFILPDNRSRIHIRLTEKGRSFMGTRLRELNTLIRSRLDQSLSKDEQLRLCMLMSEAVELLDKVK